MTNKPEEESSTEYEFYSIGTLHDVLYIDDCGDEWLIDPFNVEEDLEKVRLDKQFRTIRDVVEGRE